MTKKCFTMLLNYPTQKDISSKQVIAAQMFVLTLSTLGQKLDYLQRVYYCTEHKILSVDALTSNNTGEAV